MSFRASYFSYSLQLATSCPFLCASCQFDLFISSFINFLFVIDLFVVGSLPSPLHPLLSHLGTSYLSSRLILDFIITNLCISSSSILKSILDLPCFPTFPLSLETSLSSWNPVLRIIPSLGMAFQRGLRQVPNLRIIPFNRMLRSQCTKL